jgi:hypothetical protein
MSNKKRAVTCTASKTIINVDIAADVLSKMEMGQLSRVIDRLVEWDKKQMEDGKNDK